MKIAENLYYAESHEWLKVDKDYAYVGISDYAQHELSEVIYVDLPEEGSDVAAGDVVGSIEASKAVVDFITPVSGKIIKINQELVDNPKLINDSPYENGWIIKIELTDTTELEALMTSEDYAVFVEGQ